MSKAVKAENIIPTLRFPGFNWQWQKIRLEAVAESISSGRSWTQSNESGKYYIYGSTGVLGLSKSFEYEWKNILIARVWANAWFIYKVEWQYWVSDNALILRLKKDVNIDYIYIVLIKNVLNRLVFWSGQPLITGWQLKSLSIHMPDSNEQKKIAKFFSIVEQKIQQLSQKKEQLERYKKWVIQLIFSQKIRFRDEKGKGFSERKRTKLWKICDVISCWSKSKYIEDTGKYVIVDMWAIGSNYRLIPNKKTNFDGDILSISNLVMAKDDIGWGNIIGKVVQIPENNKYICWDHVYQLTNISIDIKYLFFVINSYEINMSFRKKANWTAQIGLSKWTVTEQSIPYPISIIEQQKIANSLSALDKKIEKVEEQIEKMKVWKKGLLQKMFI